MSNEKKHPNKEVVEEIIGLKNVTAVGREKLVEAYLAHCPMGEVTLGVNAHIERGFVTPTDIELYSALHFHIGRIWGMGKAELYRAHTEEAHAEERESIAEFARLVSRAWERWEAEQKERNENVPSDDNLDAN